MQTVCPHGHFVDVPAERLGQEVRCTTCDTVFFAEMGGSRSSPVQRTASAVGTVEQPRTRETVPSRENNGAAWRRVVDRFDFSLIDQLRPVAQFALLLGLVLALAARGWDAVGERFAAAAQARVNHAEIAWQDEWADRFDRLDEEETGIRSKDNLTASDRERLDDIRRQRQRLQDERDEDRERHVAHWDDLQRTARMSAAQDQMAGPWREILFVIGSILLSIGLLVFGFTTEGNIRWLCLVLLAIILFSVYFGSVWEHEGNPTGRQTTAVVSGSR